MTQAQFDFEQAWASSIPARWRWTRNKELLAESQDVSFDGSEELLSVSHLTGITPKSEKNVTMTAAENLDGYRLVDTGDLVINTMWAWMGALGVARQPGLVSPAYGVYSPRPEAPFNPAFYDYLYRSTPYVMEMTRLSRGIWSSRLRLYPDAFLRMAIPVPPLEEQRAIAEYLDRETAHIDTLIEEQQRLIEMLRERRRVLVTRAVCFGVDEGVELRDCGDPVVGLVPRHWTVKAVRYWLESLDGQRIPLSGEERADRRGDFDYYGASGVIDQVDGYLFDEPLVLVSEDGANLLMRSTPIAFAAKGRYWVNNHAHVLRPLNDGDVDFWAQRLEALDVTTVVSGATQPKLTAGALMGLRVSAPDDVDEQRRIAEYLAAQTSKIDMLIVESERFVELSRERRAALITAAVTGQIDVREMV
ncbi:restriction endonuclease subunit S [Plantactinospora sp. WMMB782]|uniref:restriction endonuclease subunit S n=1 Tax=Plantactinospora sp. WMMB782 TaxID=3404121 RepID=UPI003B93F51F